MPGHDHGNSIKNARVYEALRREGMPKSRAAAISNAQASRGGMAARGSARAAGRAVRGSRSGRR